MPSHKNFWNKEYANPEHLTLSDEPSEDLEKFTRWIERQYKGAVLNPTTNVLDLGCGNGRNLVFLSRNFGCHGTGYDISGEAIAQAKRTAQGEVLIDKWRPYVHGTAGNTRKKHGAPVLPLTFVERPIQGKFDLKDESVDLVLDMMSSHFLKKAEREVWRDEVVRVLKPGGWFFFKTFLDEEDLHVKRLLKENPADEEYAYIHPRLGVYEYVWSEERIEEFFKPYFIIHKVEKSHKHLLKGKPFKRRTISVYLEKNY